jgi:hypothetical protein
MPVLEGVDDVGCVRFEFEWNYPVMVKSRIWLFIWRWVGPLTCSQDQLKSLLLLSTFGLLFIRPFQSARVHMVPPIAMAMAQAFLTQLSTLTPTNGGKLKTLSTLLPPACVQLISCRGSTNPFPEEINHLVVLHLWRFFQVLTVAQTRWNDFHNP